MFEELNADFGANDVRFVKTLSLLPANRVDLFRVSGARANRRPELLNVVAGAVLGLWSMPRLRPGCASLGKDHRSKGTNMVHDGAARGRRERPLTMSITDDVRVRRGWGGSEKESRARRGPWWGLWSRLRRVASWCVTQSKITRAVRASATRASGSDGAWESISSLVELPRRALGTRRWRGHDKRSPRLRRLETEPEGVAGRRRVPFNPLNLPVRVATQSSGGRVFACASSVYLRSSKPLRSLHVPAYSRSAGRSKMVIPS